MMEWVVASCLIVGVLFSFFSALGILPVFHHPYQE